MDTTTEAAPQRRKYAGVNAQWPEGELPEMTGQEAMSAARKLYRVAMGRAFRGPVKLTSGRRSTWIRRGVFYVNPAEPGRNGAGWPELVHSIAHLTHRRLHPGDKPHSHRHAWLERNLIQHVVAKGWLQGKLRQAPKEKPAADPVQLRQQRVVVRLEQWERRLKRAQNAVRKLRRKAAYYERKSAA